MSVYVRILPVYIVCVTDYYLVTAQLPPLSHTRHDTGDEDTRMAKHGTVGEFIETKETWDAYVERLELYFQANDID